MAMGLAAIAGYVDAIGFIELGGLFVSFMSGNTTRAGVGYAGGSAAGWMATGLIALFVAGVVVGTFAGRAAGSSRRHSKIIALVAGMLALSALLHMSGYDAPAIAMLALTMGIENTVFERDGEVTIGLTYITGTLVKLGQRLAIAFSGGPRWAWLPYLLLWASLMVGAVCGALVHPLWGLGGLWIGGGMAALLALAGLALESDGASGRASN